MKSIYPIAILLAWGLLLAGCGTEKKTPHTVLIERVEDPLAELELSVGSSFVAQIRKNTKALGETVVYQHCIRHISPQKYAKLQRDMQKNKKLLGIRHITVVHSCPVSAAAQCARVSTSDYYYSTSAQLLERLKEKCQADGTWFAASKHWANTSVSYSDYTASH